jgi:HEPN domain-containing protein
MISIPERWAKQAKYDLETAQAMLNSGRYLYVLFCCQQAVEKMLKCLIAKRTGEFPPRLHNLMRLVEFAKLDLDGNKADFLRELTAYYIQSRYPEEIELAGATVSQELASETLEKTEMVIQWLTSIL